MGISKVRSAPTFVLSKTPSTAKVSKSAVYVLSVPPPVLKARSVDAYALAQALSFGYVRTIDAYALANVVDPITFSFKGAAALLRAINKQYKTTLTTDDVRFGDPVVLDTGEYDTGVDLIAKPAFAYGGRHRFRYSRFDIATVFAAAGYDLPAGNQTTIHERLTAINAYAGLALEARDVVNATVAADAKQLTLTIAATSYLYKPGTSVTLVKV